MNAAFEVLRRASLARVRSQLVDADEPDRWLHLDGAPRPPGDPAILLPSTRPLPVALVEAPPTWLWSDEPLR